MRWLLLVFAGLGLWAQAPQGHLRFMARGHREVHLDLVDGGHEAFLSIPPQKGEAEMLRLFVLTHTGPEQMVLPPETAARPLRSQAPPAWKVDHKRGVTRLRTAFGEFWRYTPGLVLPCRFRLNDVEWSLQEADLPPKMLVSRGD